MSAAQIEFKQFSNCLPVAATQTSVSARSVTAEPVSSTRWQIVYNVMKAPVFVRIICCCRFIAKSLLMMRLNMRFIFITQFTVVIKTSTNANKIVRY